MIRKMMTFVSLAVYLLMILLAAPAPADACSCAMPPSPAEAVEETAVVFSGTVREIRPKPYGKQVLFEVKSYWKGGNETQILVSTGGGDADCGIHFTLGETYLVYAHPDTYYSESGWATNICTRTNLLANATDDLAAIGEGTAPTVTVQLADDGLVWSRPSTLWYGVVILSIAAAGLILLNRKRRKR